jgi:DNA repair exonuclease SbcCD ATPase subunit
MKLQIESVEFKNFLSFGSKPTVVPFLPGVNLVSGMDLDKQKSNGAGKSSFLETVPFALFGQVHRDINKGQIINWKNRRECEVLLTFKKGNSVFSVLRAIKPDNFEIYQDGNLIDKSSHVKEYQVILNEILGLNFPTFMSLIHSNINSSAKILSMKKPDKRKFMETMFGLSLYTKLNEKCNSKLKNLNNNIREIDLTISTNERIIKDSDQRMLDHHSRIRKLLIPESELNEARENLKDLEQDFPNYSDELDSRRGQIDALVLEQEQWNGIRTRINLRCIPVLEGKIKRAKEQFKIKEEANWDIKRLKKLEDSEGTKDELIKRHKQQYKKSLETQEKYATLLEDRAKVNIEISALTAEWILKNERLHLLEEDICPTCGREFDDPELYDDSKNELMSIEVTKTRLEKEVEDISFDIQTAREDKEIIKDELKYLTDMIDLMSEFEEKTKHVPDDKVFVEYYDDIVRWERTLVKLREVRNTAENFIIESGRNITLLQETCDELKHYIDSAIELERKVKSLEKDIEVKTEMKKELLEIIHKEDMNIKKLTLDSRTQSKKKSKFIEIKDYLSFIKFLCDDKNLKQHAISSIIPYMNKQTNFYLSEVDYGFYTVLDSWLDAEIKGPGITNASYGSLSGGEGRGIDIAIQFAFLDIARLQAGIFPDYLTFDELLDSSIDGKGINQLFKIIKTRQKDDNSKIFIVSHRSELEDVDEIDNVYHVTKRNGYSQLEIRQQ